MSQRRINRDHDYRTLKSIAALWIVALAGIWVFFGLCFRGASMRLKVGVYLLLIASIAMGETEVTQGPWQLYSGTSIVSRDPVTESACVDAAKARGPGKYTCRTITRVVVTKDTPQPVNCVVSAWSSWAGGAWSTCVSASQTRQETRTRTVVTPAANGGSACPVLSEARTATQSCTVTPPEPIATLKINAGGPALSDYVADRHFVGGAVTSACGRTMTGVFQTRRYTDGSGSTLEYRIPVANGTYLVRLLWRECWNTRTGQRVLRANVEGQAIDQFDTYSSTNAVIKPERTVEVKDSVINIAVTSIIGDAMINAIDIVPVGPVEPSAGTAILSWSAPTTNTDGSALTDLAGYRISYGHSASVLSGAVQVAVPGATAWTIDGLAVGTWYFGVQAYSESGAQSALSNVVQKVIKQ